MDFVIGFLIGVLCGAVPLLFGIFTKHKIIGIVGISVTALSGLLFALLDKSPFTSIGIAAVFAIFIFARNKKKNQEHYDDEHQELD